MEEIFEISDRCTVLKDGAFVGMTDTKDIDHFGLIKMMTGREIIGYLSKEKQIGRGRSLSCGGTHESRSI